MDLPERGGRVHYTGVTCQHGPAGERGRGHYTGVTCRHGPAGERGRGHYTGGTCRCGPARREGERSLYRGDMSMWTCRREGGEAIINVLQCKDIIVINCGLLQFLGTEDSGAGTHRELVDLGPGTTSGIDLDREWPSFTGNDLARERPPGSTL